MPKPEMSMKDYVEKVYLGNYQLAMEEDPDGVGSEWHHLAVEWTQEDVANTVGRFLDQKYWKKQDQINKDFFE